MAKLAMFMSVLSYHQEGLCNALYRRLGDDFVLVLFSKELPGYRSETKFSNKNNQYPYIVRAYEHANTVEFVQQIVDCVDVGIVGSAPSYILDLFIRQQKTVFLYSERFFKKGTWRRFIPTTRRKVLDRCRNSEYFKVLAASAFLPYDLCLVKNKAQCLKWGYFPDLTELVKSERAVREKNAVSILWVARFLDWKHPESMLCLAEYLREKGIDSHIRMVGGGDAKLKARMIDMINRKKLHDYIEIASEPLPPQEIQKCMLQTDIFVATSDYGEGWGVIINESMAAGCAVVASSAMGAARMLIRHEENGYLYRWNDMKALCATVEQLCKDKALRERIGHAAKCSIRDDYNADIAAERLIGYLHGERFETGICSTCDIVKK